MSAKHPIISITGSSGAGTTSVKRIFEQIFRREKIEAAFIEGDAFHRYDRAGMRRQGRRGGAEGQPELHPFQRRGQRARRAGGGVRGIWPQGQRAGRRTYIHDEEEEKLLWRAARHVHRLARVPGRATLLFYEGLHGCAVTDKVDLARHADLKIGVVPVINLEWIQKIHRDRVDARLFDRSGHGRDPAAHARLCPLHRSRNSR